MTGGPASRLALRPRLALGEAYMDGKLTVEDGDIYDLLDLLGRNMAALEATPMVRWSVRPAALAALSSSSTIRSARRSATSPTTTTSTDQLYDFFLDRDRQYSCAYFKTGDEPLEQAQLDKKRHIAAKLLLQPGQKVLDIGSGWGGMGLFLSQQFGVDVTGVTLSKEQHAVSSRRALEGGVADRVRFKLLDYRQEPGRYDRIVSVGMFEHVGVAHYVEFFTKVKELLADDGVMLLHSIGRMEPPGRHQHLAAQVHLPRRLHAGPVRGADGDREGRAVGHRHRDPAAALRRDPAPLAAALPRQPRAIKQLAGYDDRFCRMWEFYLAGCEVAFRYMNQMVFQIQIARRQDAVPLTRDYMLDAENGISVPTLDGGRVTRTISPAFRLLSRMRRRILRW